MASSRTCRPAIAAVPGASTLALKLWRWFELPPRLLHTRRALARPGARVLDVGCGNHSPALTKRHFPRCVYHGIDNSRWNRDAADEAAMDRFFDLDLDDPAQLDRIENGGYDAVICSHVLEHVRDPHALAGRLAGKLAPEGVLYVEVPSRRSLALPRTRDGRLGVKGVLNFHDDETHRTMVDLERLAATLRERGCAVTAPRYRRLWRRLVFLPAYVFAGLLWRGYVPASVLWDITGFAQYVVARRSAR
jgi:2-polyprenyl-3-methyl-5-hydroxy-6-metoxy-1,4-benzoquinol methylase